VGLLEQVIAHEKMSTLMTLRALISHTLSEDLHANVGTHIHLEEVLSQTGESH